MMINNKVVNSILLRWRGVKVMCKLAKTVDGSLGYRLRIIKKYYPVYIYHSSRQHSTFISNLQYKRSHQLQQTYKTKIKSIFKDYTNNFIEKLNSKKQTFQQQYNQLKNNYNKEKSSQYEKQARNLLHHGMDYLSLYYQSLQSIIEGRREVLHDDGFVFEDGESLEYKRVRFEKYLGKLLGRSKEELQRMDYDSNKWKQQQKDQDETNVSSTR